MDRARLEAASAALNRQLGSRPAIGIVLGSGLAPLAAEVVEARRIPTSSLPGYPPSTVLGHEGVFLAGKIAERELLMLSGRIHAYEGYGLDEVVMPVRLMALAGVRTLILTNAAGGLAPEFQPGDLMLIEDHLNLQGNSPLRGPNVADWGPRFPDMTEVYSRRLRELALARAGAQGLDLRRGVYASCPGPQYETPAEIRMLRALGADAVGMSTVPEAIVARHMGLEVLAFSVISNLAAGISPTPLDHEEVVAAGLAVGPRLAALVRAIVADLPEESS
ncbi:MAG: purine-nucleoside phosphorylase [Planctomycetes bacterium]|nr:purine-nucleoside phosphorylase [Planctomycetota bacterium]